MVDTFCHT